MVAILRSTRMSRVAQTSCAELRTSDLLASMERQGEAGNVEW
jgi:hypothetical protein